LIRNIQKRLFLGIGTELLIKSCYLKNGFAINKPIDKENHKGTLLNLGKINVDQFNPSDTFTIDPLINSFNSVIKFDNWKSVEQGLKILKVFRNKEGHVAVVNHEYIKKNYEDIANSISTIYESAFGETLEFKISMEKNEKGKFKIK
jgi:hypothetical protein